MRNGLLRSWKRCGFVDAQVKELSTQRLVFPNDSRSLYLGSAHGIYVIDAASLAVSSRWLTSTAFGSLIGSSDGPASSPR